MYDDAKTIYADLFNRLNAVIATINTSLPGYPTDPYFSGNMNNWLKVANTIKLQM